MKHAIAELEVALEEERAELVDARHLEVDLQVDIERAKEEVKDLIQELADAAEETAKHAAKVADLEAAIAVLKTAPTPTPDVDAVDAVAILQKATRPSTLAIAVATIMGRCMDDAHPIDTVDMALCVRQLQAFPVCMTGARLLAREKGKTWSGMMDALPKLTELTNKEKARHIGMSLDFASMAGRIIKDYGGCDAPPPKPAESNEFMDPSTPPPPEGWPPWLWARIQEERRVRSEVIAAQEGGRKEGRRKNAAPKPLDITSEAVTEALK